MEFDAARSRGARLPDELADARREPGPRRRARRRRRFRREVRDVSRGGRPRRSLPQAEAAGEVDRGPPRALPRRGAGARPVLGPRSGVRKRRSPSWRARPHDPRRRRLHAAGHQPSLQRLDGAAGAVPAAGLRDHRAGGRDQQGRDHAGARRRLSRRRVRHGAGARSHRRRAWPRPRRGAAPQSGAGGDDPLHHSAQVALGVRHHARQRRLPALSADGAGRDRLPGICRPAKPRPRRRPLSRHRRRQWGERHRPRSVRIRHRADRPVRPHLGLHRRHADGPRHQDRARADLRRAVQRAARTASPWWPATPR